MEAGLDIYFRPLPTANDLYRIFRAVEYSNDQVALIQLDEPVLWPNGVILDAKPNFIDAAYFLFSIFPTPLDEFTARYMMGM